MLEIVDLYAGYYRGLDVLRGVSLRAPAGKITAVLGANGVGKSTLLKAVFGFIRPSKGHVLVDGRNINGVPPHRMAALGIGYIPQQPGVFADMSVQENVTIGGWLYRSDKSRVMKRFEDNIDRFPALRTRLAENAGNLSGGQRRMVELARALMSNPQYLLVDEPSAGLAPIVAADMYRILVDLKAEGLGILLVEQEIRRALEVADYVYVIDLGKNRLEGPPTQFGDLKAAFWGWSGTDLSGST